MGKVFSVDWVVLGVPMNWVVWVLFVQELGSFWVFKRTVRSVVLQWLGGGLNCFRLLDGLGCFRELRGLGCINGLGGFGCFNRLDNVIPILAILCLSLTLCPFLFSIILKGKKKLVGLIVMSHC